VSELTLAQIIIRRKKKERLIELFLFLCAASSVFVTLAIVSILLVESIPFFQEVSIKQFLFDTEWTPLFDNPRYGIWPLLGGTFMTSIIAISLALPSGIIIAGLLSEYLPHRLKEILKPCLELLAAVPTVVYGYFALLFVTPFLQKIFPSLSGFNVLSAGLVMGIMIIPYISSLSEDALRAVPVHLKEASIALGATKFQTFLFVMIPSAFSGIISAVILGISRALGETMVVAIAAGMQPNLSLNPMEPMATITAYIVQVSLGDVPHGSIGYKTIYVAGLSLFCLTLTFNLIGIFLRKRFQELEK
jgi:phosphate transport system permease protein